MSVVAFMACAPEVETISDLDLSESALVTVHLPEDIGRIRDLHVDGNTLTVLTQFAPHIHVVDLATNEIRSFGQAGEGPMELRNPQQLVPLASLPGTAVWDANGSRLLAFDADGGLVVDTVLFPRRYGTVIGDIERRTHGNALRLAADGDAVYRVVYDSGVMQPNDLRGGRLLRTSLTPGDTATIVDFAAHLEELATDFAVLVPLPLWDRCQGAARTVILDPDRSELLLLDDATDPDQPVVIPSAPRAVTDDDLRQILFREASAEMGVTVRDSAEFLPEINRLLPMIRQSAPAQVPVAVDVRCFENAIWVQEFDNSHDSTGRGLQWLRYSMDEWVRISLPTRFQLRALDSSRLFGIVKSALDEESVAILTLDIET